MTETQMTELIQRAFLNTVCWTPMMVDPGIDATLRVFPQDELRDVFRE
jgi:hypothetical protein